MPDNQPLRINVETEDDGRILASVPELPGVMAYGATESALCTVSYWRATKARRGAIKRARAPRSWPRFFGSAGC
jgi:hypothetical protein